MGSINNAQMSGPAFFFSQFAKAVFLFTCLISGLYAQKEPIILCPEQGEPPKAIPSGTFFFPIANEDEICTLTKVRTLTSGKISSIIPLARSYHGHEWENAPGQVATSVLMGQSWSCNLNQGCKIHLPDNNSTFDTYVLTLFTYALPVRNEVARLFESATFGTQKKDLDSWNYTKPTNISIAEWVKYQINEVKATSHRRFWRKRSSPRWPSPQKAGQSYHPCAAGSRWRKFTFVNEDKATKENPKYLEIAPIDASYNGPPFMIFLDGHLRTVVNQLYFKNASSHFDYIATYMVCKVPDPPSEKYTNGRLHLRTGNGSCEEVDRVIGNPAVNLSGVENHDINYFLLDFSDVISVGVHLDRFPVTKGENMMLVHDLHDNLCQFIPDVAKEGDKPVFGLLPDGTWLIHDTQLKLESNTLRVHLIDGGQKTKLATAGITPCSNAPRSFLNANDCTLVEEHGACGTATRLSAEIMLDDESISTLKNLTGRYIYAVVGLSMNEEISHPCKPKQRSRWQFSPNVSCPNPTDLRPKTQEQLKGLMETSSDTNLFVRDIVFPKTGHQCDLTDIILDIQIQIGADCWSHVHPDYLSVYDFTYWTRYDTHPGNSHAASNGHPHPIKKWFDLKGSARLVYPSNHPRDIMLDHSNMQWKTHNKKFKRLGRLGDVIHFHDLPDEIRLEKVAQFFGRNSSSSTDGVMVCGSPGEVANDPSLGSHFGLRTEAAHDGFLAHQKDTVWTNIVLSSKDQLRQRTAWALNQLFAIEKAAIKPYKNTEIFLNYHDIFVRHAFGNFLDVLREIAYSPLMAENLSFLRSKSSAYVLDRENIVTFPDENFAREIMQLFTIGLIELNIDGTPKMDSGSTVQVYSNDDIMSFARAWTGFDRYKQRGNTEDYHSDSGNRLDPMRVEARWRDKFPKTDLIGGYIGDGYPLCVDLPEKMFLRQGAKYRLLGGSSFPELMMDDNLDLTKDNFTQFVLSIKSMLLMKLMCKENINGKCIYRNEVTINQNLFCSDKECDVDAVRVVQVAPKVFYEYIRPPCVEQLFFNEAMKISRKRKGWSGTMCANTRLPAASEACCPVPVGPPKQIVATQYSIFDGERMTFRTSEERCKNISHVTCDFDLIGGGFDKGKDSMYHWAYDQCEILAKVNSRGDVAVVYDMEAPDSKVNYVDDSSKNYFPVFWRQNIFPSNNKNECATGKCTLLDDGDCLCRTATVESVVFHSTPSNKEQVLSKLKIGALRPYAYDGYSVMTHNEIIVYTLGARFCANTVFEVKDDMGRTHFRKNVHSIVNILGMHDEPTSFSFRNTPHFMSLVPSETDSRDAYYETEAVLNSYFYHSNTAPFLGVRLIQRFGISNPTPRYVKAVAEAFKIGAYESGGQSFGNGKYGNLEATIAAIILDREARTPVLDADPSYGCLREPILKVISFMRNLNFVTLPNYPLVELVEMTKKIGQMPYGFPSVFSFFLSEYVPDGRLQPAELVSPEAMTYTVPNIIGILNGFFSMIKYGLSDCHGGFGKSGVSGDCEIDRMHDRAVGFLNYKPGRLTTKEIVDDLALLLTSGRLSAENRNIVQKAYDDELTKRDKNAAIRIAQQLIVTSAEFHSTNLMRKSGNSREVAKEEVHNSSRPYRAIIFLMFKGGCDSFSMLIPHTCSKQGNSSNMLTQYQEVRQQVAIETGMHEIAASNQVCEKFGVHPNLPILRDLYNNQSALFFANTGALTKQVNRDNFEEGAATQLFAHNTMQKETKQVDPFSNVAGTGVMGRLRDVLTRRKIRTGAFSIDANTHALVGTGLSSPYGIVSKDGIEEFDPEASSPDIISKITDLNNDTLADSGFFAEKWSVKLLTSLSQNDHLFRALNSTVTADNAFPDTILGQQLKVITQLIRTSKQRNTQRELYYVEMGGFDTHSNVLDALQELFHEVNDALVSFVKEMKKYNLWENVALIQTSEFGRTLTPNGGDGTDHAWGGNYFMLGGSVRGGRIMGKYPNDITDDAPLRLRRGRLCPSTSWDMIWNGIAQWMGVKGNSDLDMVCPNRKNFLPTLLMSENDLFLNEGRKRVPT